MKRAHTVVIGLSVVLAAAGCTDAPSYVPVGPSTTASVTGSSTSASSPGAVVSAGDCRQALEGYLAMWVADGLRAANARYLAGALRTPGTSVDEIRLSSGKIRSWEVRSQAPLVAQVDLDLAFRGDPGAWGSGVNTRFVTCVREAGEVRLELATSP